MCKWRAARQSVNALPVELDFSICASCDCLLLSVWLHLSRLASDAPTSPATSTHNNLYEQASSVLRRATYRSAYVQRSASQLHLQGKTTDEPFESFAQFA